MTKYISTLVGEHSQTTQSFQDLSRMLERLTATYLFSGQLPGQGGRAFITLPHFGEALTQASVIAQRLNSHSTSRINIIKTAQSSIQEIEKILRDNISDKEKIRKLAQKIPKSWMHTIDATSHFRSIQEKSFVDPGFLTPLDEEDWGHEAGFVEYKDFEYWDDLIISKQQKKTVEAVRADMLSLATIVNLYRKDNDSLGINRTRKYLFITSDTHIERVVWKKRYHLQREGIPFFVRSPLDYLPVLNLNAMSQISKRNSELRGLTKAFHDIFDRINYAVNWIGIPGQTRSRNLSNAFDKGPLLELERSWKEISELTALLSISFHSSETSILSEVKRFVESNASGHALELLKLSVKEINDKHLIIAMKDVIRRLSGMQNEDISGIRRIHLFLAGREFINFIGFRDLNELVDSLVKSGEFDAILDDKQDHSLAYAGTQVVACCAFIAADEWSLAAQAARVALDILMAIQIKSLKICDVRYLAAHCARFSMRKDQDLRRGVSLLEDNLRTYSLSDDSLAEEREIGWRLIRDKVELGSIYAGSAIMQSLFQTVMGRVKLDIDGPMEFVPDSELCDTLNKGYCYLNEAFLELSSSTGDSNSDEDVSTIEPMIKYSLNMLCATNLLEIFIFERVAPGLTNHEFVISNEDGKKIIDLLESQIEFGASSGARPIYTNHIYCSYAKILMAGAYGERSSIQDNLLKMIVMSRRNISRPTIDILEFEYIYDQILPPLA